MSDDPKLNVDFRELGQTGLKRTGGFIQQEFLQELSGLRGVKTYTEMSDNDPTVSAVLFAIEHLTRQVKWRVKPASMQPQDAEAAEFLETCMDDMSNPFVDVISEAMSMVKYGFAPLEIVYKRRAGASEGRACTRPFACVARRGSRRGSPTRCSRRPCAFRACRDRRRGSARSPA